MGIWLHTVWCFKQSLGAWDVSLTSKAVVFHVTPESVLLGHLPFRITLVLLQTCDLGEVCPLGFRDPSGDFSTKTKVYIWWQW